MSTETTYPVVGLTEQEKKYLLRLARHSLQKAFHPQLPDLPAIDSEKIKQPLGVFVTLHESGELRGCIGYVEGIKPLNEAVIDMAISAAFKDPRFDPLRAEELQDVEIEISVLSPLKKIEQIEEIEVGKHGIFLIKAPQRGLLLPQVALEWGWDRQQFLEHACLKAGLLEDCWKDSETEIYIFSAEIFDEKLLASPEID